MLCNSCGFKVHDSARFCRNCGAEVNTALKGTLGEGAYSSVFSHKLQPVTQSAPKRFAASAQSPSRFIKPTPAVASITAPEPSAEPQLVSWDADSMHQHDNEYEDDHDFERELFMQQTTLRKPTRSGSANMGDLVLGEGEAVLKTYSCTASRPSWYSFPRNEFKGFLSVTNKRIVYRSQGPSCRGVSEIPIETYRGFECYYGPTCNVLVAIFGAIVSMAALLIFFMNRFPVAIVAAVIGLVFILASYGRNMVLKIHSEPGSSPISLAMKSKLENLSGGEGSNAGGRAEHTDAMMAEFGAIVNDVITMGDKAIEKWGV